MSCFSGAWALVGSAKKVKVYSVCWSMHVCVTVFDAGAQEQAACIQKVAIKADI